MSSLEKCLFRPANFLIRLFVCLFFDMELRECLYILKINRLLFASFANIFSHYVGCLSVLFVVSLLCKSV